ncbi:BACON domain-containing protein [Porphyromonadaceae bacterium W3.11]|nr:BACON domain-containing protein [Porphyromonadaceae bacterium W3.11]
MKRIFIYALTGLLMIAFTSCLRDSVLEQDKEIYIELSEEVLTLSNDSDNRVIEVKTNASSWNASKPASSDWLKLVKNSNNLLISAQANKSFREREARIFIEANGVSKEIIISQAATKDGLELSHQNVSLKQKGGEDVIKVLRGGDDWSIEGSEQYDWFTVLRAEKTILVKALENNSLVKRIGKFYINTPTSIVEVIVTQDGKDAYILPYLPSKHITKSDVLQDAKDKGMFYIQGIPNEKKTGFIFEFEANDGRNSKAGYEFMNGKDMYSFFRLYTVGDEYGESEDFHNFLISKGFKFVSKNIVKGVVEKIYDYSTYYYAATLIVQVNPSKKFTELTYEMSEVQSGDMPTFVKFPYRNTSLLNVADFFEVKAWEESKGGTIEVEAARTRGTKNPNIIASAQFSSLTNENSHLVTLYFFEETLAPYIGKLSQKMDIYTDTSLGLWKNSDGKLNVTREFADKLKAEGFEYQSRKFSAGREWITYFNMETKLVLMLALVEQTTGESHMALNFYVAIDSNDKESQAIALANANRALNIYR